MPKTTVNEYYATKESKIGYKLFLSNTRHFGYYSSARSSAFPIARALRHMEQKLYELLDVKKGKVLDAGCGVADVASYMANKGLQVEAIDIVDRHIKLARHNIGQRGLTKKVHVQKMNYESLRFDDDTFDGIYTMETFVHAQKPEVALQEFYRTLKPGGKIALFEYDKEHDDNLTDKEKKAFSEVNNYASMPTFQKFTYGTPERMLIDAGFENIQIKDMTLNIEPMLRLFHHVAFVPYLFIRLFSVQHKFVNAMSAVEYYRLRKKLRYVSIVANKPS